MGVMSCYRFKCENIMCQTYIDDIGYICSECQSEFKEYMSSKYPNDDVLPEGEIIRLLDKFMDTRKNRFNLGKDITVDDFFNSYNNE